MEEGPGEVTRVGAGRQSGEGPGEAMCGGAGEVTWGGAGWRHSGEGPR